MGVQLIGMAGMLIGGTLSGLLPFNTNVGRNITKYFHSWEKKNLRGIDQQFSQELAEINRGWETFREDFWGIGFIASPMNAIAAALVAEKSLDIGMSALNVVTGGAAQHALENFLNSPEVFDTRSRNSYYYNEAAELPNKVPEDLPSQLKMLEKVKKEKPELAKKFLDDLLKNPELKAEETKWVEKNLPPAMSGIVKDMNDAITSGKVGATTPQEIAAYKSQVGDIIKKTFEGASKEGKFKVEPPSSALDKTIAAVESVTKSMPAAQAKPTPPVAPGAQSASQQKPASQPK
jgi:polyhydroxyalkanoate synthesis regulator phasin